METLAHGTKNDVELQPEGAFSPKSGSKALRAECRIERRADELGRNSLSVSRRISNRCAGWVERPTAEEFCEAIRAARPTPRQCHLISMWVIEATDAELALAWIEEAYTFRELVAAIHRTGAASANPVRNPDLNRLAMTRKTDAEVPSGVAKRLRLRAP